MKKQKMKIRNMLTGEVVTVWPSTDHPDSSYGIPVWVDRDGNGYGQTIHWEVPFGFERVIKVKQ